MHELSIAQAILHTVEQRAGGRSVRRVDVRIGHLRQVVPDSLAFAWEMVTTDTLHEGCVLEIEHVPAVVRCRACAADTTLDWPILVCGSCESHDVELVSGEEFQLVSLDVADGVEPADVVGEAGVVEEVR